MADFGYKKLNREEAAAKKRDINSINELISKGANLEESDNEGRRPIHYIVLQQDTSYRCGDCMVQLVGYGVNIDAQDCYGYTALHYAVLGGFEHIVTILLDEDVNIDLETKTGYTAFMMAAILSNRPYYTNTAVTLSKAILKRKILGLPMNQKNLQRLKEDSPFNFHDRFPNRFIDYEKCLIDELDRMKKIRLSRYISLYDIIVTDDYMYTANNEIDKIVRQEARNFQHLGSNLDSKVLKDRKRYEFIRDAKTHYRFFMNSWFKDSPLVHLPEVLIEKVLSHVDITTLQYIERYSSHRQYR